MIPQDTIEQVRQASDIIQIIGEYVRLKRRGRDWWAVCPFHQEKSPSFKVSPDKQFYHCFGCGKGGNVFSFLMEHEAMSFVEAVKFLARRANIVIQETRDDQRRDSLDRLNYAHEVAIEYYHKLLFDSRYAVVLKDYLRTKRGINDESIETFKLGLSGEAWDGLINYAARKDLTPDELVQAGLALKHEQKGTYFDRFRQRLMIPIFNLSQRPIAFGGRTLKKGEPAKYVNSPETPLYNKSYVLYGLNFARDYIREKNAVYVVEGYFDLISLYQNGIRNVVASSGTAFTPFQARLLARFAEDVYLFFDADSAGRRAALRSVEFLFDAGLEVKVVSAPPGEDPDSLVRVQGPDAVEAARKAALPYIDFRVRANDLEDAGIIAREKLTKELAALAFKIGDPTRRALFIQDASSKLNVNPSLFQVSAPPAEASPGNQTKPGSRFRQHEFELLSILLQNPASLDRAIAEISPDEFDSRQLARIYAAMLTQYKQTDQLDPHRLVEIFQDQDLAAILSELVAYDWDTESPDEEAVKIIKNFGEKKEKRHRDRLKAELAKAQSDGDLKRADAILAEMKEHGLI